MEAGSAEVLARVAARVRELLATYEPPSFDHVPDPDAALFLCAVDHKSGYEDSHVVDGEGPLRGSALMWAVGLARGAEARRRMADRAGASPSHRRGGRRGLPDRRGDGARSRPAAPPCGASSPPG